MKYCNLLVSMFIVLATYDINLTPQNSACPRSLNVHFKDFKCRFTNMSFNDSAMFIWYLFCK